MKYRLFVLAVAISVVRCQSEQLIDGVVPPQSSFEIIQRKILEPNCVACHEEGSSFARQSNLILTAEAAYSQLVNRIPQNESARNNGLELVGTKGLESLFESFLWEKINFPDFEHFYADHPEYGELMPLGGPSLTNGEMEYIRKWIVEGAPESGIVVDDEILDDDQRFELPSGTFEPLEIPISGIQVNLGPFEVAPDFERELFYYQPLENDGPIFVNRVEISMKTGSHHFILYDYPNGDIPEAEIFRDLRNPDNSLNFETLLTMLNQRFVFGTQWRTMKYDFPEGVALKLPSSAGFDLNSHYVNRTDQMIQGEISVNLHTLDSAEVAHHAHNLFLNNDQFQLPIGEVTTLSRAWTFNERRHVFQLTSHAHEHLTEFRIYVVGGATNGELVFFSKDWEHPPLLSIDPPLVLEPGQGLRAEATYDNDTDRVLTFGFRSVDEMMIIFGAYYLD